MRKDERGQKRRRHPACVMLDAHVHLWDPALGYPWLRSGDPITRPFTPADLEEAIRTRPGVKSAVVIEAGSGESGELARNLTYAARSGLIAAVIGSMDSLTSADGNWNSLAEREGGEFLQGVRVSDNRDSSLSSTRALEFLNDLGLVLEVQAPWTGLAMILTLASRYRGITLVVDHLGSPPAAPVEALRWQTSIEELAKLPNTYCKVSAVLSMRARIGREAVQAAASLSLRSFGSDRLMIGSDWPVCLQHGTYADSLDAALELLSSFSSEDFDKITATNAARVYSIHS